MERQYIGARYVPKLDGDWDSEKTYEALTIVNYHNASYTSKKPVPAGTLPTNTEYWVMTGSYNGMIQHLEEEIAATNTEVDTIKTKVDDCVTPEMFGAVGDGETDDTQAFVDAIAACKEDKKYLKLLNKKYRITSTLSVDFSLKIKGQHYSNWHYGNRSVEYGSTISADLTNTSNTYLLSTMTGNRGCITIEDVYIDGNNKGSCLNLVRSGWTFSCNNLVIDNFAYHAINFDAQYDSNINNLTIERCGGIEGGNVKYAVHFETTISGETWTNALHINNLHMEFCRYYINFSGAQDIVFNNCKFELLRYVADSQQDTENARSVDDDLTNPLFLINASSNIVFAESTFCFRGLWNWSQRNPNAAISAFPYMIEVGAAQFVSFDNCRIFSPDRDGGFIFLKTGQQSNISLDNCYIENLTPRRSTFEGDNISIRNCYLSYWVVSDEGNTYTGAGSTINACNIENNVFVLKNASGCTNNDGSGFLVISGSANRYSQNQFISFGNVPTPYAITGVESFTNVTSGTTKTAYFNAPSARSGLMVIKLQTAVLSSGSSSGGRVYVKMYTSSDDILIDGCDIPVNTNIQTRYCLCNLKKGETVTIELMHTSNTARNMEIKWWVAYA